MIPLIRTRYGGDSGAGALFNSILGPDKCMRYRTASYDSVPGLHVGTEAVPRE
jgi:hypothetical protein